MVKAVKDLKIEEVFTQAFKIFKENLVTLILSALLTIIGSIFIITAAPLTYGFFMLCIKMAQNKKGEVKDVLDGFNYFFRSWGILIVMFLIIFMGLLALILPGIALTILLIYTVPISIIKNLGVTDSLNASYNLAKDNLQFTIMLALIVYGINIIFSFIPFGNILTMPFVTLGMSIAALSLLETAKKE